MGSTQLVEKLINYFKNIKIMGYLFREFQGKLKRKYVCMRKSSEYDIDKEQLRYLS